MNDQQLVLFTNIARMETAIYALRGIKSALREVDRNPGEPDQGIDNAELEQMTLQLERMRAKLEEAANAFAVGR